MATLDDLKKQWKARDTEREYDAPTVNTIIKNRVRKNTGRAMQYFWASFVYQIIIYVLLTHVLIRYGSDTQVLYPAVVGLLMYIPFTIMLMGKYKRMAVARPLDQSVVSIQAFVLQRRHLLASFFRFKKVYELVLVPLSSAIGVYLVFRLFIPGGVVENPVLSAVVYLVTLASCFFAIRAENRKNFIVPLQEFDVMLDEFAVSDSVQE